MRRQLRWYGASPLHLLSLLACFGLAGYAADRLVPSHPLGVAAWFLGAVIGHDLLLMPLYSLADRSAMAAIRHRDPQLPVTPWINYVRVPAALSGLLLLVWFPLILRLRSPYHASTTLSADPYVWHWLAVTGALFLLSAVAFAVRLRGKPPAASPPERPATAPAGAVPEAETDPGHPGDADSGRGQPPAVPEEPELEDRELEEREPGHRAGEFARLGRIPPGSAVRILARTAAARRGRSGRARPRPPSACLPQHDARPADPTTPDTQ